MHYEPPPDTQEYHPQPRMTWFNINDVPDVPHHRSSYLHTLNVTLETTCESDEADYPEIAHESATWRVWNRVHRKVFAYWLTKRDADASVVSREHRYLLWHVWARMQFVLHRHARRLKCAHESDLVCSRRLRMSNDPVRQYSVSDLWRAIHALITAWNTLRYSDELLDYASALATQCGRYFWVALPTRRTFDHPSFVARVSDADGLGVAGGKDAAIVHYCVNDKFIVETERLFFRLLGTLHEHEELVGGAEQVHTAPRATSYAALNKWIRQASDVGAVREFVASDFTELVYARRAHLGEVERFSEKDQHADPTPYNAIAQMRPEVIDQMSDMIEQENLIEVLMDRIMLWGDDAYRNRMAMLDDGDEDVRLSAAEMQRQAETDIDASDITITAAGYLLDDAFISDHIRFASWFVCNAPPVTGGKKFYPVLVHACNSWHVAFGTALWLCDNAADAVECWVRKMCASPDAFDAIRHVAPRKEPFFVAHRKITGGERAAAEIEEKRVQRLERGVDTIMVPLAYEDERGEKEEDSDGF